MTPPEYYEDSYLRELKATVTSVDGDQVELDQTIFYPEGGGQPGDTGMHVLGSLIPVPVTGGSVGPEKSRLDFDLGEQQIDQEDR